MVTLRLLSTALLFNERDELLMMKRAITRTLSPGKWGAVGGHVEPYELRTPLDTCLREIFEETGIQAEQIENLRLRYILMRLFGTEIRQQFFFVGRTNANPTVETDEGELFWVPRDEVLNRDLPFVFRTLLEHYFAHEHDERVWIGSATSQPAGGPAIIWNPFIDPQTI